MTDKVELEAILHHPYGTGFREVGEHYFATQADADLLVSLGRARLVKAVKPAEEAKQGYKTRDLKAKG